MRKAMGEGNPLLLYMHIPKTAGSTFSQILSKQYQSGVRPCYFEESLEILNEFKKDDADTIKCVYGHFLFGLHTHISRSAIYITLLRDPVERVISLFYFWRSYNNSQQEKLNSMSLKDFICSDDFIENANNQTCYLAGGTYDLQLAKENMLNHFTMVGLTERFDESLFLFQKALGWQPIDHYVSHNMTPNRPRKDQISSDVINLILCKNQLDFQLYEFAKELFEERIRSLDSKTQNELRLFLNKLHLSGSDSVGKT